MKRYIKSSAGDVTLYKFVLVQMDMLPDKLEDADKYDNTLNGYFYLWPYTYNTITRHTDDRMYAHSDVIDNLPSDIRRVCREHCIWGKTDWFKDQARFYINDDSTLSQSQLNYIKRQCNM